MEKERTCRPGLNVTQAGIKLYPISGHEDLPYPTDYQFRQTISVRILEKEYTADRSMICRWGKEYIAEGESSLIPKGHPGNHFAALHVIKNLSGLERLRLMVAKLEIENERLKKDTGWKKLAQTRYSFRSAGARIN